jgi:hypothetical protein
MLLPTAVPITHMHLSSPDRGCWEPCCRRVSTREAQSENVRQSAVSNRPGGLTSHSGCARFRACVCVCVACRSAPSLHMLVSLWVGCWLHLHMVQVSRATVATE